MSDISPPDKAAGSDVRGEKSDSAFRTISEVSDDLGVPQHVLRFWESRFSQIKLLKRGGGRRYYRPDDITLLKLIKSLLYTDGLTIKGVQKLLRDGPGAERIASERDCAPSPKPIPMIVDREGLERMMAELTAMRDDLRAALSLAV